MFKWLCLALFWGSVQALSLNDPTRPSMDQYTVEKDSDEALPKVSSIMISSKGRSAVIDGRMVKLNDRIGDFEVLSIDTNRVRLKRDDQVFEVEMVSGFLKKQNRD